MDAAADPLVWMPRPPGGAFVSTLAGALEPGVFLHTGARPADAGQVRWLVEGTPRPEDLDALPALEGVIVPYAGIPRATREALIARPSLHLHNLHHNAANTAEMAVTLMAAALKHVLPMDRALRASDWTPRYEAPRGRTLEGLQVLVLGFGAVGRRVARACLGFGMAVTALRRHPAPEPDLPTVQVVGPDALQDALAACDVLHVCLPGTDQTRGLIGASELDAMRRGSVLVNTGRGSVVSQGALYHALASGHLAGAGLDVWWNYPEDEAARTSTPPSDHPFHQIPNVVMSPHRAGMTEETEAARARHLAHLLNQLARREPMDNAVDPRRGY